MNSRVVRCLLVCALTALALPASAPAETGLDLSDRILIDGFSAEFTPDESLFQSRPSGGREESLNDSEWGVFNDLNQIKLTWDANFVYVAIDGFIFDNNTMIFFDTVGEVDPQTLDDLENPGLEALSQVNSWRRAVSFSNGLRPEIFLATWDTNPTPQIWRFTGPNQVSQAPQGSFPTVATFSRDLPDRAMEAAIPWELFFVDAGTREFDAAYGDTIYRLPRIDPEIRIAAWITAGADGTGGPDSAPDNLSGHQVDSAIPVVLDNYIRLRIDRFDADGNPQPDGVPDFNVPVRTPTTPQMTDEEYTALAQEFFLVAPPIRGTTLQIADVELSPKAIAPELGDELQFSFRVTPPILDPGLQETRRLEFTAEVYDMDGTRVRTIYVEEPFTQGQLDRGEKSELNRFDGLDDNGNMLEGGIYILRVVLEKGLDQTHKPFVVVQ